MKRPAGIPIGTQITLAGSGFVILAVHVLVG
jgi:hypothetical protein